MSPSGRYVLSSLFGVLNLVCACGLPAVLAATPGEIPNPATYEGSLKLQQQYDQQQQQGREQQRQQQQQSEQQWQATLQQQQAQANAAAAQAQAVLRAWQKRPPLTPEHNPLLGRWNSQGVSPAGAKRLNGGNQLAGLLGPELANMTTALLGGITGRVCDSMLGRGLIEFRPTMVVAIGRDGSERAMYRAEYRGGGSRVVVLPQAGQSFTHMIIDFESADHAMVDAVGCVLVRGDAPARHSSHPVR